MMDDEDDPDGDGFAQDLRGDPDVGYGRPPKASQFKPGQSGNPRGRPRGAKTRRFAGGGYLLRDALVAEAERPVQVREMGQDISMSQMQAVARQTVIKAMQGNMRAAELMFKYTAQIQRAEQRQNERFVETMVTYKAEASAEVKRRIDRGIYDMSDILPHPDHIDVDFVTGEVLISGPMSPGEKAAIDVCHELLQDQRQALAKLDSFDVENLPSAVRKQMAEARRVIEARIRDYAEVLGEPYS
jgi:hypothetical protein